MVLLLTCLVVDLYEETAAVVLWMCELTELLVLRRV